ncbi:MAG: hypothetical protein Ct9H300mP17_05530 [Candidatus Nitrosopelagicus sp.]|nr:MAG: hypothetical protein Ct9H300mP17_05530 [Candidatus Nitrosopelagicus sp.]
MDFMLEEEMIDLLTFCLQNPESDELESKKSRFKEIGKELFDDGGVDAMENFFFAVDNRFRVKLNNLQKIIVHYGMEFPTNGIIPRKILQKRLFDVQLCFTNSEHRYAACWACTFCCWFTIFHGYSLSTVHFSFVSAFYAVTYYHVKYTAISY